MPQFECGQFGPPNTGTATAPTNPGTCQRLLMLYPDPAVLIYISNVAFSNTSATGVSMLQPGGPPVPFEGPIAPSSIYMLAASGSPTASWVGY